MDKDTTQKKIVLENLDFDSKQNLVGFFDLLLEVDMRVNPDLYKEDYKLTGKEQL